MGVSEWVRLTALTMPTISPSLLGAMPRPVHTLPTEGFEDVTYGYVPKSMSSIVALAPVPPATRHQAPVSPSCMQVRREECRP